MILQKLKEKNLINPPKWILTNTLYLTMMGSEAYGVSSGDSDIDVYGVVMPPKGDIFPHLNGYIFGFGPKPEPFTTWVQHHIDDKSTGKEYDISLFSIVKYFHLMLECNPTMINSLFVPRRCILHSTRVSEHLRANRKLFLHKGCKHKFLGYAYSQMHKMDLKTSHKNPKRAASIEKHGYDVKYALHLVRLVLECEMILSEHDLDIERNRELLKSIRRGEWTLDEVKNWFASKEKNIEDLYTQSTLKNTYDYEAVRDLLLECIEEHYGKIDNAIKLDKNVEDLVNDIQKVLEKYNGNV